MDQFYKQWQELQYRYILPHMNLCYTSDPYKYLWCPTKTKDCQCDMLYDENVNRLYKKLARDDWAMDLAQEWCQKIISHCQHYLQNEDKNTTFQHAMANYLFHANEHDIL